MVTRADIDAAHDDLAEKHKRADVQARLATTNNELAAARAERTDGITSAQFDQKQLAAATRRIGDLHETASGYEEATALLDAKIAQAERAIIDLIDQHAREREAQFVEDRVAEIERLAPLYLEASSKLVSALRSFGEQRAPEAAGIAHLIAGTNEAMTSIFAEVLHDLRGYARDVRAGQEPRVRHLTGVQYPARPAPETPPDGQPSGTRYIGAPFSERHPGF